MRDLYIKGGDLFVPQEEQDAVIEPAIEDFLNTADGSYASTFELTREAVAAEDRHNDASAYFVPAVRFGVRTALDILRRDGISDQLSDEVESRALISYPLIRHVVYTVAARKVFNKAYKHAGIPKPSHDRGKYFPKKSGAIGGLASAVFGDAMTLGGGALKVIRESDESVEDELGAVQHSYGLLKFARLLEQVLPQVHEMLGSPYVHSRHLVIAGEGEDARVRFNPDFIRRLERMRFMKGDGCPAARMSSPDAPGTVLQEDWRAVLGYLITPAATLHNYDESDIEESLVQ